MVNNPPRVVLDSNILISAYVFGGKPESILYLIIEEQIIAVTAHVLISEFLDVLSKKFNVSKNDIFEIENEIHEAFEIAYPTITLQIVRDIDDNRVLEVALEGKCDYIITGDKELLNLGSFRGIGIMNAGEFLTTIGKT